MRLEAPGIQRQHLRARGRGLIASTFRYQPTGFLAQGLEARGRLVVQLEVRTLRDRLAIEGAIETEGQGPSQSVGGFADVDHALVDVGDRQVGADPGVDARAVAEPDVDTAEASSVA